MAQRPFQEPDRRRNEEDDREPPRPSLLGALAAAATIGAAALAVGYVYGKVRRVPDEDIAGDEQAIKADNYGQPEPDLSAHVRDEKIRNYYQQAPQRGSIKKDNGTEWSDPTWEQFAAKFNGPQRPQLTQQEEEECLTCQTYEEVRLPSRFNFTGVILWYRETQGLLHTFARHHGKWAQFIPEIRQLKNQLPGAINVILNKIQKATRHEAERQRLYKQLEKVIEQSANATDIRAILMQIQFQILDYLRRAVLGTYIGDIVYDGGVRHMFRVGPLNKDIIAVATSKEIDIDYGRFSGRPFRSIITAFFVKESQLESPNFVPPQNLTEEQANCSVM